MALAEKVVLDFIQNYIRCDFLDRLMVFVTRLGNGGMIWIIICLFMLAFKKYRKTGVVLAVGLIMGFVFGNLIMKPLLARPRPSWTNEEILLLITNPTDFSFPSGHTLSSFVSAYVISRYHKRARFFVIPLAAVIAFSRMYLYVHYPTDILGGIVLGILFGYLATYLSEKYIFNRKNNGHS